MSQWISSQHGMAYVLSAALLASPVLYADTPADFLQQYRIAAQAADASFQDFSASRGERLFNSTHGNDWSCATCHSAKPAMPGKHIKTGKIIEPLAPAAHPARFTDPKKVDKWFRRNCKDVLDRECTALEKGDILSFLLLQQP